MRYWLAAVALLGATMTACAGGAPAAGGPRDGGAGGAGGAGGDGSTPADGAGDLGGGDLGGGDAATPPADTLAANRDCLLATYLAWLQAHPGAQSNGLDGATLAGVCDLWARLAPSDREVFLTLTARMQGSRLGADGRSMLAHVTRAYRVVGGQGATATSAGSCGGGEYNRMILSMDGALHDALVAANDDKGAAGPPARSISPTCPPTPRASGATRTTSAARTRPSTSATRPRTAPRGARCSSSAILRRARPRRRSAAWT